MTLHAEVRGNGAATTPLVLLHGFGGRAAMWRDVIDVLPPAVPVIAYDMPGHAGSLSSEPGGAGRMAKAVLADLEARGISRIHLCGHSLGGATAALIALRAGEKVDSLTLLAPGGFGPEINADALAVWRDATDEVSLRRALQAMCAEGFAYPNAAVTSLAEARQLTGAHAALAAVYEAMFVPGGGRPQGMLPVGDMARLRSPVQVLWGTADRVLPVSQCSALPGNVTVKRLDGAGHMLVEERADDVAAALSEAVAAI